MTGFTLFPLAVHTAMLFSFLLLFQKEMGCCAITNHCATIFHSFLFLSCEKVCSNTTQNAMVKKLHCVVYLALVVGFPTWNVTAGSGDEGGLLGTLEVVPSAK